MKDRVVRLVVVVVISLMMFSIAISAMGCANTGRAFGRVVQSVGGLVQGVGTDIVEGIDNQSK